MFQELLLHSLMMLFFPLWVCKIHLIPKVFPFGMCQGQLMFSILNDMILANLCKYCIMDLEYCSNIGWSRLQKIEACAPGASIDTVASIAKALRKSGGKYIQNSSYASFCKMLCGISIDGDHQSFATVQSNTLE
jgi:hypothetical protein